jgi:uncharacterized SAM-binding protein YcdF (DUF218 family)
MNQETVIILKSLILPPGGLILLGLISLLFSRRLFGKILLSITLALFYLLSTPFVADNLLAGLERYIFMTPEEITSSKAEAIVVLCGGRYQGAPEYGGDTIYGLSLERMRYAAWLQKRTKLPIIVSGGSVEKDRVPEAILGSRVLKDEFGSQVLATEDKSVNTWENALFTSRLLSSLRIKKVALVTHAWHMPRAMEVFSLNGVDAIAAPTIFGPGRVTVTQSIARDWLPDSKALRNSYYALHEYLGLAWYRLKDMTGI